MRKTIFLLSLLFSLGSFGQSSDVVFQFPLDGSADDVSGNNRNGNIIGSVTATTDRYGNASGACQFDGSTGFIDIPYSESTGSSDFTIMFWSNSTSSLGHVLFKEQNNVGINQFRVGGSGTYSACFSDQTNSSNGAVLTYTPVLNVWNQITCVRRGMMYSLYSNGLLVYRTTIASQITHNNNLHYRVGANYGPGATSADDKAASGFFSGKVDDLVMYKRAFSESEVLAAYVKQTPNNGLIAWYKMDGNGADSSGNAINLVENNITATTDRFGKANSAIMFGGVDNVGYMDVLDTKLDFSNAMSFSCWVNLASFRGIDGNNVTTASGTQAVFAKAGDGAGGGALLLNSSGFFWVSGGTTSSTTNVNNTAYVSTLVSNWVNAVLVLTPTKHRIYVDAQLVFEGTGTYNPAFMNGNGLSIGRYYNTFWYPFNGSIDDVKIFNRELTASEVTAMYNENSLMAYYPANGVIQDESSYKWATKTGSGVSLATDRNGKQNAIAFDGTNNAVVTLDSAKTSSLFNKLPLSYSFWFNANDVTSTQGLINKYSALSCNGHMAYITDGNIGLLYGKDVSNMIFSGSGCLTPITANTWYHCVVNFDASGGYLYLNGVLKASLAWTGNASVSTTAEAMKFGDYPSTYATDVNFNGKLDDIRIFNRTLSQDEINAYFAEGGMNKSLGLLGYFPLNGNGNDSLTGLESTATGTISPVVNRFGVAGTAMKFDKTWYQTQISQQDVTEYSVSVWVKMNDGEVGQILNNRTDGTDNNCRALSLSVENDNTVFFGINGANKLVGTYAAKKVNDGQWHHIVGVFKGTAGVAVIQANFVVYIDGVLMPYVSHVNDNLAMASGQYPPFNGNGYTKLGNLPNILSGASNSCALDEVRIYNRAISQKEVTDFYNEGDFVAQNALNLGNTTATTSSTTTGQYASVPAGTWFNGDFTLDTWMYLRSNFQNWERIIDFGTGAGTNNVLFTVGTSGASSSNFYPCVAIYNGATPNNYYITSAIPLNAWTHVALTLSGTTLKVYYNGVLVSTITGVVPPPAATRTTNYIGRSNWSADYYMNAMVDEFRLYDYALSQDSIIARSHRHLAGNERGLQLYYDFNQTTGSAVTDLSPSKQNATVYNTPAFSSSLALLTPFTRAATNITPSGFTANWDIVPMATKYEVITATKSDFSDASASIFTTINLLAISATSTTTYYKVRALNQTQVSEWSTGTQVIPPGNALTQSNTNIINVTLKNQLPVTFTIEGWLNPSTVTASGFGGIIGKFSGNTRVFPCLWLFGSSLHLELFNSTSGGTFGVNSPSGFFVANQWVHYAVVCDGSSIKMYKNGVLVSTEPVPGGVLTLVPNSLLIVGALDNYYSGKMDELRIWSTARTESEINQTMHTSLTGKESNLFLYYNFDELSGNIVHDLSGNAQNGSFTQAATSWVTSEALVTPFIRSATNVTTTSFTANWDAIPGVKFYVINLVRSTTRISTDTVSANSITFTGLMDGTAYTYDVTAVLPTIQSQSSLGTTTTLLAPPGNGLSLLNDPTNTTPAQYAQVPSGVWFNGDFTVDSWVFLRDYSNGNHIRLFDFGNGSGSDNILFSMSSPGGADLAIRSGTAVQDFNIQRVPLNKWTHVAMTMKGDSAFVYYDGVPVLKGQSPYVAQNVTRVNNYIGKSNWSEPNPSMIVDEFRIYNKSLSQDSLIARSHRHLSGKEDGLILYYDFDQASGTTVADLSPSLQSATLYNSPTFVSSQALLTPFIRTATGITQKTFTAHWDTIPMANVYQLQTAFNKAFTDGVSATSNVTSNSPLITLMQEGLRVYYRVRSANAIDTSEWALDSVQCTDVPPGNALSQNGTNIVSCTLTNPLPQTFTVEYWISPSATSLDGNYRGIVGNVLPRNFPSMWALGSQLHFEIYNGSTVYYGDIPGFFSSSDVDTWIHVAWATDGSTSKFYRNGVLVYSASTAIPATLQSNFYIGKFDANPFVGKIDELRFWDYSRSENEINSSLHGELNGSETGLVAYYNFNKSSGSTLTDVTGKNPAGTFTQASESWVESKALLTPFVRTATNITANSFTARWDKVALATACQFNLSLKSDFSTGDTITLTNVADTFRVVTGLSGETDYFYRVRVLSATDTSEWSCGKANTLFTPPGNALSLNGGSQYALVPSGAWFKGAFTVSTWVNINKYDGNCRIFDFGNGSSSSNVLFDPQRGIFSLYNSSSWVFGLTVPKQVPLNRWVHVAITMDGTKATVYYDGEIVGQQATTALPDGVVTANNYIGKSNWDEFYLDARFDEFRVYNVALLRDSIIAQSHRPATGDEQGLILSYDFDNNTGTTASDGSLSKANATLMNGAAFAGSRAIITPFVRNADARTKTSFTAHWDKVPAATSYQFNKSLNSDFSNGDTASPSTATDTSKVVAGLTEGTDYYYRVRALSASDTSEWSGGIATTLFTPPGNALSFNGSNSVRIPYGPAYNSDLFTISFWAKPTRFTGDYQCPLGSRKESSSVAMAGGYNFYVDPSNNWTFWMWKGVGAEWITCAGPKVNLNMWTHVSVTYDGAVMCFYVDGVRYFKEATSVSKNDALDVFLGCLSTDASAVRYFNGSVDELSFWDKALDSASIVSLAHHSFDQISDKTGLSAYFDFNQNGGTGLNESVSQKAIGTLVSSPTWVASKALLTPFTCQKNVTTTSFDVAWNSIPLVKDYKIQSASDPDFTSVTTGETTTDTIKTIAINGAQYGYYYRVRAVMQNDTVSEWSAGVFIDSTATVPNNAYTNSLSITVPNTSEIGLAGNATYTMSTWVKFTDMTGTGLYSQYGNYGQTGKIISLSGGKLSVMIDNNSNGGWQSFTSPIVMSPNVWNHIAYTQDNGAITMYINGLKSIPSSDYYGAAGDNTMRSHVLVANPNTNQATIGGSANSSLDNFQVWSSALSQDDIIKYAHSGVTGSEANLAVAYDFDQIYGTEVKDLASTIVTNGTVVNSTKIWTSSKAQFTPFMLPSTNITDSSFAVKCNSVPGATTYKLRYSIDPSYSNYAEVENIDTVFSLSGLINSTQYYLSVKAVFPKDSSEWSPSLITSTTSLTDSLIAYYPFNSSAADASGHNANCTVVGSVNPSTDRFGVDGKSYSFNGGYLSGSNTSSSTGDMNDLYGSYTVAAWINPSAFNSTGVGVLAKHAWEGAHVSGYILAVTSDGSIAYSSGDGSAHVQETIDTAVVLNAWQFLCMEYSAPDSIMGIYLNGNLVSTIDSVPPSINNPYEFLVGLWNGGEEKHRFKGGIDDIRMYRRGLSDREILSLYHENGWPYTGVALTNQTVKEQQDIGAFVGKLSPVIDASVKNDTAKTFTYRLTGGTGSTDNARFTVRNDSLFTNYVFDVTVQQSAAIRVKGTNLAGVSFEKSLAISVVENVVSQVLDFEGYDVSALNGQDGWKTMLNLTTNDFVITSAGYNGYDTTKLLQFSQVGPGVGGTACKKLTGSGSPGFDFTDLSAEYTITFDVFKPCWGFELGIGADLNDDGIILQSNTEEKALYTFMRNGCGGTTEFLTLPDGTILTTSSATSSGARVEIKLSNLNKATSKVNVRYLDLTQASSTWVTVVDNVDFVVDSTSTGKLNPKLWNMLIVRSEGASTELDNVTFKKRTVNSNRTTIDDGMIAHYLMDGNTLDATTKFNGVQMSGYSLPIATSDRFGNPNSAYDFAASGNFSVPGIGQNLNVDELTVSVWAKTPNDNGASIFVFNPDNSSNRLNAHIRWGGKSLYFDYGDIYQDDRLSGSIAATNDAWEHYVFVSSNSGHYMKVYLNNVLVLQKTVDHTFSLQDAVLAVGGYSNSACPLFQGSLDDMRIYGRALSEEEISAIYTDGGWPVQSIVTPKSLTLQTGKQMQLPVSVLPSTATTKGLLYSSSNPAYATINNNGVISAMAEGSAIITVTTSNGSVSAQTLVSCVQTPEPITSINLVDSTVTLIVGQTQLLKYKYLPKKAITSDVQWKSTNILSAPVANGTVTAVEKGTSVIYVYSTSPDSANVKIDSCYVTVLPSLIPVTVSSDTVEYRLKAVTQTGGVWDKKDSLRVELQQFFSDDDTLAFTVNHPNDTVRNIVAGDTMFVFQRDTALMTEPMLVTVTATDLDGQVAKKYIIIKLLDSPDTLPVIDSIPSAFVMYQFRKTVSLNLRKYVHDDYTPFEQLTYDTTGYDSRLTTVKVIKGTAFVTVDSSQTSSVTDSVHFSVVDSKKQKSRMSIPFIFKNVVNEPPVFTSIDTVKQDGDTTLMVDLGTVFTDDYSNSFLKFSVRPAVNVNVYLVGSKLYLSSISSVWNDYEKISVTATDEAGASKAGYIIFKNIGEDIISSGKPNVQRLLISGVDGFETFTSVLATRGSYIKYSTDVLAAVSDSLKWTLEGANPGTYRGKKPLVRYDTTGVFDVELNASNEFGTTKYKRLNAVTVVDVTASSDTICLGQTVELAVSDSSLSSYAWNTGGNTYKITATPATTTSYIVKMVQGTNEAWDTVTIHVDEPVSNVANDTVICKGTPKTISTSGFEKVVWNNTVTATSFVATKSEKVSIEAWVNANCPSVKDTIQITSLAIPDVGLPDSLALCAGVQDTLVAMGGENDMSYVWNVVTNVGNSLIVDANGLYKVTVTNSNGCSSSDSTKAIVVSLPPVSATVSEDTICQYDTAIVSVSGPGNSFYAWSKGVFNDSLVAPSVSGNNSYTVTATNYYGCTNTASVSIAANATPVVSIVVASDSVCSGTAMSLSGVGATSFSWSDGVSDSKSFVPSASRSYVVTGTDAKGCSATASVYITVLEKPAITISASRVNMCVGDSVLVHASGGVSSSWDLGVKDSVLFKPTISNDYTVTVTDRFNCENKDTIRIEVNALPAVEAFTSKPAVCQGDSVMLSASGADSYNWAGGIRDSSFVMPDMDTTYTVVGTDTNGCKALATIPVAVNPLPNVSAVVQRDTICKGYSDMLTGTGAKTYVWTSAIPDGESFVPPVSGWYTVTGTDANGCSSTDSVEITLTDNPTAVVTASDSTICLGDSVWVNASGAKTVTWIGGQMNDQMFVPTATAVYVATISNENGCTGRDSVTIVVNALPEVVALSSKPAVCQGDSAQLTATGALAYAWTGKMKDSSFVKPTATAAYSVTGVDANGCSNTSMVEVTVKPIPPISIVRSKDTVCQNASVMLTATGADSFTWSDGVTNGLAFQPTATKFYVVTGTTNACYGIDSVEIAVSTTSASSLTLNIDSAEICVGASVTLDAEGPFNSIVWSNDVRDDVAFTPSSSTTYNVTAVDVNNCEVIDSVPVIVHELPAVAARSSSVKACANTEITLQGQGAKSYVWDNSVEDNVPFTIADATTFNVTGTSEYGCASTASVAVDVMKTFAEQIKVVTYSKEGKSIIVGWTPTPGERIATYDVQRLNDTTGEYTTFASVGENDLTYAVDNRADATAKSYSYRLLTHDSVCLDVAVSDVHKTMHLANSLSSESKNKVELTWTPYVGASFKNYKIYVISDGRTIDSLLQANDSSDVYTYTYSKHVGGYTYRIVFDLPYQISTGLLKSDSGPYSQSLSNIAESELFVGSGATLPGEASLFPNPASDVLHVALPGDGSYTISIVNALGEVFETRNIDGETALFNVGKLDNGIYFVRVQTPSEVYTVRFFKQ